MSNKVYLAFDIDGTIYKADQIVFPAFQEGIKKFIETRNLQLQEPSSENIIKLLGLPVKEIFKKLFPTLNRKDQSLLAESCNNSLADQIYQKKGQLIDDVPNTLELLYKKNYTLLAASNGKPQYILSILKSFDLIQYFSEPILFLNEKIKDKNELIKTYKNELTANNLLIMIGDRFTDKEAALNNKIPFIGCNFGYDQNNEIAGSKWIVNRFKEIPNAIKAVEKSSNF